MILLIFVFGLVVGSFINCVLYRLYKNQSFIGGRSYCPNCKRQLGFWDLIPVFSFLFLRGKCRYCRQKISWQYPFIELITALIFCLVYWATGLNFLLLARNLFFSAVLIIIFVFDLKYQLISDRIIIPAVIIAFLFNLFLKISWLNLVLGVIIGSSLFLIQYLISKGKWIGFGDIYLGFSMGAMLGWQKVILAIVLGYFIGSITAIVLLVSKKETLKSKIALGPFLVVGACIALLYGEEILNWYFNRF